MEGAGTWRIATRLQRDARGAELVEVLLVLGALTLGGIGAARALRGAVQALASRTAAQIEAMTGIDTQDVGSQLRPESPPPTAAPGSPIQPTDRGVFSMPPGFDPEHPPQELTGTRTFPGDVSYKLKITAKPGTTLGPNGESLVDLRVTRNRALGIARSESLNKAWSAGAGVFVGDELSYGVTLREEDYHKVLAGELPFPDPGDVRSLPDGSKVLLRSEDFVNTTQSLKYYKLLGVSASHTDGHGSAVALEARGDQVRVLAGPTDVVSSGVSLSLGGTVGKGPLKVGTELSLTGSNTLRDFELRYADVSKDSGQLAFEQFMKTAEVPRPGEVGITDAGEVHKLEYDGSSRVEGSMTVGPKTVNGVLLQGRSVTGRTMDVEHNDGRHDISGIASEGGVSVFENVKLAPDGTAVQRQTGLLLDRVDHHMGAALGETYGQHTANKSYDVQLEMNQQQYMELRNRALDDLAVYGIYTPEQIAELRAGPDEYGEFKSLGFTAGNNVLEALAYHRDVDGFLRDGRLRFGGKDTVAGDLISLRGGVDAPPLPGTVHFYENARK